MSTKTIGQPLYIRGRKIENRVGFAPMGSAVYTGSGFITDESIAFYRSVARGGTGLIVQGCAIVAEDVRSKPDQLGIWSDEQIPRLRLMTEAVHGEGKRIIAQLQHCGIRSAQDAPPAPSKVTVEIGKKQVTSREMTVGEIKLSQRQFLDAALRAVRAGYDGVEIHCSHGWLISTFLSGVTNHRTDEYGKDPVLYLREVFQSIRAAVPDDFIVGVRISGYVPDIGTGLAQARRISALGVDYISVSVNYKIKFLQQDDTVPGGYPFDPMVYAAHEIKKAVSVPVFAAKGIRTGEIANRVLGYTDVDMVLVGRGHLCDPEWTNKALAGEQPNRCFDCKGECSWRVGTTLCPALKRLEKARRGD